MFRTLLNDCSPLVISIVNEVFHENYTGKEQLVIWGFISVYTGKTIAEMAGKVLEQVAGKYQNFREGVKAVMGGRVLEYEAKNKGRRRGTGKSCDALRTCEGWHA